MSGTTLTVIAMENELPLAGDCDELLITGVGALNVISSLSEIDRNTQIMNVGYAGSNSIQIGERVRIGKVASYHPTVEFDEPEYRLDGDVPCYTASDFVTETDIEEPCVFDMELAYILAMGFTDVISEKVISDNLSFREFEDREKGGRDAQPRKPDRT